MTREQFLEELKRELAHLPESERAEILRDQEEYLRDAVASNRDEAAVVAALGSPKAFAANLSASAKIQSAEASPRLNQQVSSTFGAVIAVLALAPLNIFFVLGPFMTLVSINVAGWIVAACILLGSTAALGYWLFKLVFVSAGAFTHLSSLFFILGCAGAGVLALWAMYRITAAFVRVTLSYLKWNLGVIRKGSL